MLQGIRDGAQGWLAWVIVIIICIPFALWGIQEYAGSSGANRAIAEVNGVELSEVEFQRQVNQEKQRMRAMFQNQNIDFDLSFMDAQIKKNTLKQMIDEQVIVQSAREAGMRISDNLLTRRIHSIQAFQENGDFSQERYKQTLQYFPGGSPWFEDRMRQEMLTAQIRDGILRSAFLTDYDVQQRSRLEQQERLVSYLIIPASRFKDVVTISDTDIDTYYKDNALRYMTPEKVSIEYVELSQKDVSVSQTIDEETLKQHYQERKQTFTKPGQWKARHILIEAGGGSEGDELEAAKKKALDVLVKIRANESFEDLAKQFSDDPGSKNNGGDLGWFGPKTMVKPFEDAVKSLKVGEVSELVKTQFGFHIIKLDDIKPEVVSPFAEVRTQLEQEVREGRAQLEFDGQAEQFANLAFEHPDSLEVLTQTLNLKSKTTELFDKTGSQQKDSILANRKVVDAAFSNTVLKEGYNSDVIEINRDGADQHIVVLRMKDHEAAKPKPIADVKDDIISTLSQERMQAKVQALGKSLVEQIKEDGDSKAALKTTHRDGFDDLSWSLADWIKRQDTTLNQTEVVREAFKMGRPADKKAIYHGINLSNGDYALVAVFDVKDGVVTPDSSTEAATEEKDSSKEQQQQALGFSEFNQLLTSLKTKTEIKDYSKKLSDN